MKKMPTDQYKNIPSPGGGVFRPLGAGHQGVFVRQGVPPRRDDKTQLARSSPSQAMGYSRTISNKIGRIQKEPCVKQASWERFFAAFSDRDVAYFDLFEALAKKTKEAAVVFCDQELSPRDKAEQMKNLESEADTIAHTIVDKLDDHHRPPLKGRREIYHLVHTIDNVLDYLEKAANRIALFRLSYTKDTFEVGNLLLKATYEIESALPYFRTIRNGKKSSERIKKSCVVLNDLEEHGDHLYRGKILPSIEQQKREATTTLEWHELDREEYIFELLERALDQCEDVGDFMESLKKENV